MKSLLTCVALVIPTPAVFSLAPANEGREDAFEDVKLTAPDTGVQYQFGHSVSLSGDTMLAGTPGLLEYTGIAGSVYVFVGVGSSWAQQAKFTSSDAEVDDQFGSAVSLSGEVGLIGAYGDDDGGSEAGAAYVFTRSGSSWSEEAKLVAADPAPEDNFGECLALDGDTAIIGAPFDDDAGINSGSAYVFVRSGGGWNQQAKLTAGDAAALDQFGTSVSIDGDTVLVGSIQADIAPWSNCGAAYVFVRSGGSWTQQEKLYARDGVHDDFFGTSVCVQGDRALIGMIGDDDGALLQGSAYIFERSGSSWIQEAKLVASDPDSYSGFGWSVSLENDRALVGAPSAEVPGYPLHVGAGYTFTKSGAGWNEELKLMASDGSTNDGVSYSVSLWGTTAVLGTPYDDPHGAQSGSVYIFSLPGEPGTGYCFGDPGSGTPCPCGNDNDGSVPGSGCANGPFASGAQLTGDGTASVSADSMTLIGTNLEPLQGGLYFQGDGSLAPGVWGDGLRCVDQAIVRLQVRFADSTGVSSTSLSIAAAGGATAGETKYYQLWYRNPTDPPCGTGLNDFNTSNAYEVVWLP